MSINGVTDMTSFASQITTESGDPLADVEAWIEKVPGSSRLYEWHGGFEVPAGSDIGQTTPTFCIKLSDGREGKFNVTNYHPAIDGPAYVEFQGTGPLE